jgi:HlyD family secretion protein
VQVRLVIWQNPNVLKVPQGTLFRHGDGFAVFRLDSGIARRVPVTIGQRGESEAEVLGGLRVGDSVVVHPADRVQDGIRVATH